jgi:hypothetical protein
MRCPAATPGAQARKINSDPNFFGIFVTQIFGDDPILMAFAEVHLAIPTAARLVEIRSRSNSPSFKSSIVPGMMSATHPSTQLPRRKIPWH